jgi:hypothetical protein
MRKLGAKLASTSYSIAWFEILNAHIHRGAYILMCFESLFKACEQGDNKVVAQFSNF